MKQRMSKYMGPATAGVRLGVTAGRVLQMIREGKLPAIKTVEGWHLLDERDVERLRIARKAAL